MELADACDSGAVPVECVHFYSVTARFLIKVFCIDRGDSLVLDLYFDADRLEAAEAALICAQLRRCLLNGGRRTGRDTVSAKQRRG